MFGIDDKATSRSVQDGPEAASAPERVRTVRTSYPACPCRECGTAYTPTHLQQEFCSPVCKKAWNNRAMVRGLAAYELLMEWRARRRWSLISALCALVRDWRAEDRDAGRTYRPRIFNPHRGTRELPPKRT